MSGKIRGNVKEGMNIKKLCKIREYLKKNNLDMRKEVLEYAKRSIGIARRSIAKIK